MNFGDFADGGTPSDGDYMVGYAAVGGAGSDRRWRLGNFGYAVFNVALFGAIGDNVADDLAAIQATVAAAAAAGGGTVFFPPGNYLVSDETLIESANIRIVGSGGDSHHDGGTGVLPATTIRYGGAANANKAVIRIRTPISATSKVISGGGVEGVAIDCAGLAGYGLFVQSLRAGKFSNLFVKDATVDCYHITAGTSLTDTAEAADTQQCLFERCYFRVVDTAAVQSANGFTLTGSSNATGSFNTYLDCFGQHWNGAGFNLLACDNEKFLGCRGQRSGGTGYDFDLGASCGSNFFLGCLWGSTLGFIVRTPALGTIANYVFDRDYGNSAQIPVLESGASIYDYEWRAITSVISSTAGTITSSSVGAASRYLLDRKTITFQLNFQVTDNGTGSSVLRATMPVAAKSDVYFFGVNNSTGDILQAKMLSGNAYIDMVKLSTGAYPAVTGNFFFISGTYEIN